MLLTGFFVVVFFLNREASFSLFFFIKKIDKQNKSRLHICHFCVTSNMSYFIFHLTFDKYVTLLPVFLFGFSISFYEHEIA